MNDFHCMTVSYLFFSLSACFRLFILFLFGLMLMNVGLQFALREKKNETWNNNEKKKQKQGWLACPDSYKTGVEVKVWMASVKSSMKISRPNRNNSTSNNKVNSMSLALAGMCGLCPSPIWPLDSPYPRVRNNLPPPTTIFNSLVSFPTIKKSILLALIFPA